MGDLLNPVKVNDLNTHEVIQPGEIEALTAAEVATAIKQLKSGKAAGVDEIRPDVQIISLGRNSLVNKSLSTGIQTWKNTEGLANRSDHPYL